VAGPRQLDTCQWRGSGTRAVDGQFFHVPVELWGINRELFKEA
jgi:hypothetical protein